MHAYYSKLRRKAPATNYLSPEEKNTVGKLYYVTGLFCYAKSSFSLGAVE